uniref:Protein kinase domain-containing protein n=1 Tax=Plectus sambesii TaxID=2011161 RepID=A0A914V7E8_9BILA
MVTQKLAEVPNITLFNAFGKGYSSQASIYFGKCKSTGEFRAVGIYPLESDEVSFEALKKEIALLKSLDHPNVLPVLDSSVSGTFLCVTTPLMDYGSVSDVVRLKYTFGLPEKAIAMILKNVLQAVCYLHKQSIVHRGIKSSHILLSSSNRVCLAGFRCCARLARKGAYAGRLLEFSAELKNNLLWLAPEVLKQDLIGYGLKSDVYSIGITACEMANGFPPFADMEQLQMLFEKERGTTPRLLDISTLPDDDHSHAEQRTRQFSDNFHEFTDLCLKTNPDYRLAPNKLLDHPFFSQVKKGRQTLSQLLPTLRPISSSGTTPTKSSEQIDPAQPSTVKFSWDF